MSRGLLPLLLDIEVTHEKEGYCRGGDVAFALRGAFDSPYGTIQSLARLVNAEAVQGLQWENRLPKRRAVCAEGRRQ